MKEKERMGCRIGFFSFCGRSTEGYISLVYVQKHKCNAYSYCTDATKAFGESETLPIIERMVAGTNMRTQLVQRH